MKQNSTNVDNSVPFLSKVPLVGKLFNYKSSSGTNRELLVFLTPRLAKDELSAGSNDPVCREQFDAFKNQSMRLALDKAEK